MQNPSCNALLVAATLVAALVGVPATADWPQFRGLNSSGIGNGQPLPESFEPGKNERWSIPVGSGHSSPVVIGDSIYLTTYQADSETLSLLCIRCKDGTIRWQHDLRPDQIERGHSSFNPASSTPAADQDCVVAYFGSFGLICFDHDGNEQWRREMSATKSFAGNATSPAIADGVIYVRSHSRLHAFAK